jgi:transglutaminase-like putative cysteine protease
MTEYLAPTKYCDRDDASLTRAATAIGRGRTERDAAVRLFRFVRDEVRYAFGPWGIPASSTLARRFGTCSNKSNLLVALFRARGIPAAYGVMRVDGQEYFGNINPPFFRHLMSRYSIHVYAAAYLDGAWVKCDPSTDRELAGKTGHFCEQTSLVRWDGRHDALDRLDPAHVHADEGLRPSIDEVLGKPARNATAATCGILNAYLRFVRSRRPFVSAEALIEAYLRELGRPPGEAPRAAYLDAPVSAGVLARRLPTGDETSLPAA